MGLRIFRPARHEALPVVAFCHGGGFWMGGGATCWAVNEARCREIAARVGAVVVSIDYRLAPEDPFPAAAHDVDAALRWIDGRPSDLGPTTGRVALFGISSGGNLVAGAAQRALDGTLPAPVAAVLQVPSLDLSDASSRFRATEAEVRAAHGIVAMYTGGHDPSDPAVSPGLRPELAGLAPTLLLTADHDPLTADANRYAKRLAAAGVDVEQRRYPMLHSVASPAVAQRLLDDAIEWLRGRR